MQAVTEQIHKAFEPSFITQRKDMAPLAFALAAVSGRRLIEVMVQGEFEVAGKYEVIFYGQAKKRTGEDKGRKIYVLCDPALFVQRVNELRSCPAAADFDEIRSLLNDDSYRAANVRIASILVTHLTSTRSYSSVMTGVHSKTHALFMHVSPMRPFSGMTLAGRTSTRMCFSLRF